MENGKFAKYSIQAGRTKTTLNGTIIEQEYLNIEAETKKEAEQMFDKRWEKKK